MRSAVLLTITCLSAVLLATPIVRAQIETTPIPPNPKPDFSSMQYQLGTWNCTERNTRRPGPYTNTSTTTMDPTGYWMITKTVNHPSSWSPRAFTTETRTTYDGSTTRWVSLSTDTVGGYDMSTASGWQGNTITWHDEAYPKTNNTSSNGDTITTKVSDTKTTYTSTFTEPNGRTVNVTGSCTKG